MPTPPVPLPDLQRTVDIYLSGHSIRAVAKMMNLSYTATRHRLANLAGVQLRRRNGQ
jgi:hypothetical protein